ncbi:MIP/aquaporin family protein [Pedobacter nutrimenti]|uniref:Glycerol uptake facilitator protein n=1 Tax=Pedobacter nutrimenti TaxID=1241337 RepID=A0A318UVD2_9SPHI|nr:MIP/aquaporin family protein [Pedobacter nutrimenti]PYF75589.1 glycerol uptake facilitator protein [Pedobacter nutrimenti]
MTPFLAEFIGTALLILLGDGVVANVVLNETKGNNSGWMVITTAWALAVFVGVTVAGPVSGAHLNPAVTLGLALTGQFAWSKVLAYILAQLLGAAMGAFLVWLMYRDHFNRNNPPAAILAVFSTGPAIRNYSSNLISEMIGTFVLVFTVFYISGAEIIPTKTPIGLGTVGAIPVAFLVWVIGLSLGGTTGYAINPVRDLGPRIMHALLPIKGKGSSDWAYAWIPIIGPLAGAALAALVYNSIH